MDENAIDFEQATERPSERPSERPTAGPNEGPAEPSTEPPAEPPEPRQPPESTPALPVSAPSTLALLRSLFGQIPADRIPRGKPAIGLAVGAIALVLVLVSLPFVLQPAAVPAATPADRTNAPSAGGNASTQPAATGGAALYGMGAMGQPSWSPGGSFVAVPEAGFGVHFVGRDAVQAGWVNDPNAAFVGWLDDTTFVVSVAKPKLQYSIGHVRERDLAPIAAVAAISDACQGAVAGGGKLAVPVGPLCADHVVWASDRVGSRLQGRPVALSRDGATLAAIVGPRDACCGRTMPPLPKKYPVQALALQDVASGREIVRDTRAAGGAAVAGYSFSPDDGHFAYLRSVSSFDIRVGVMDTATGRVVNLEGATTSDAAVLRAVWAGADRLVVQSRKTDPPANAWYGLDGHKLADALPAAQSVAAASDATVATWGAGSAARSASTTIEFSRGEKTWTRQVECGVVLASWSPDAKILAVATGSAPFQIVFITV